MQMELGEYGMNTYLLRLVACLTVLLSFNAFAVDTDGDGFSDADEATLGTDPNDPTSPLENKLTASDGAAQDSFGYSVALSNETALIGAIGDDDKGGISGSVYVYVRSNGVWIEQAKLTASDGEAGDYFGNSVALDGDTAIIGSYNSNASSGSAYVFTRIGATWTEQTKLTGSASSYFGRSVSISDDTVVIGAPGHSYEFTWRSGSAYVFTRSGSTWTEQAILAASDRGESDSFGSNVSISGNTVAVSSSNNYGSVYVFTRSGPAWEEQAKLSPSDTAEGFGASLSIADNTVLIGAPFDDDNGTFSGSVFVFTRSGAIWTEQGKLYPSDTNMGAAFGRGVAIYSDKAVISGGGGDGGWVYIFTRSGSIWTQQAKLNPSDAVAGDYFSGDTIAIFGNIFLTGARRGDYTTDNGSAYIFPVDSYTPALITGDTSADIFVGDTGKGTLMATDIDGLTDGTYFSISNTPVNGQALINAATGNWIYTANNFFIGSDPFTATVTDDLAGTTEQIISISVGNVSDNDSDGTYDHQDNCPNIFNSNQANLDGDPQGDACDLDVDGDLILDSLEVAAGTDPKNPNDGQTSIDLILGLGKQVPAMGGIGLLALGLSMLGLGAVRLRRK